MAVKERAVVFRTYKVRFGYKRDVDENLGNNVHAVRLWVEGILQVRAYNKTGAKREALYFLRAEFEKPLWKTIVVFSVERRKRGGR